MREIQDRPLRADELAQFEHYRQRGFELLGASPSDAAKELVRVIDSYVDEWQEKRRGLFARLRLRAEDSVEIGRALAVLWGDQIVRQFGWEWICEIRDGSERYGVAAPDRSLAILAPEFIERCLTHPNQDCTLLLAFNMQADGAFAGCLPNDYVNVMSGVHRIVPKR